MGVRVNRGKREQEGSQVWCVAWREIGYRQAAALQQWQTGGLVGRVQAGGVEIRAVGVIILGANKFNYGMKWKIRRVQTYV